MDKLDAVRASLRSADKWRRERQPAWVSKCVSSALMGYLSIAVSEQPDAESGFAWLVGQNVDEALRLEFETLKSLSAEVVAGRLPSSAIGGIYHPLTFAHMAWGLNEFELGEAFVAFAAREEVGELGTPFWREYARGMAALVNVVPYVPGSLRLKGQEKYWEGYLRFMEAKCNVRPIHAALAEIDKLFAKRNCDKRVKDDGYQIEGSGDRPVKWDFRLQSLLRYADCR